MFPAAGLSDGHQTFIKVLLYHFLLLLFLLSFSSVVKMTGLTSCAFFLFLLFFMVGKN